MKLKIKTSRNSVIKECNRIVEKCKRDKFTNMNNHDDEKNLDANAK